MKRLPVYRYALLLALPLFAACGEDSTPAEAPPVRPAVKPAGRAGTEAPTPPDGIGATGDAQAATIEGTTNTANTVGDLAPSDAFAWIELRSLQEVEDALREVSKLVPEMRTGTSMLDEALASLPLFGITPDQILWDQPLAIGLSLNPGTMEPAATFILPLRNPAATAARFQGGAGEPTARSAGTWLALSLHEAYAPDREHGETLRGRLGDSLLACNVNVKRLMDTFGLAVHGGLTQAMRGISRSNGPDPVLEAFGQSYVTFLGSFLDSARYLSFELDLVEGDFTSTMSVSFDPGTPMAGVQSAERRDLRELATYVDDTDALLLLGSFDKRLMQRWVRPMVDGMALAMDFETGAEVRSGYATLQELLGSEGSSFALIGHLEAGATDFAAILQGVDGEACAEHVETFLDDLVPAEGPLAALEPLKAREDGSRFLQYDYVAAPEPPAGAGYADPLAAIERAFGAERVRVRVVTAGDEVVLSIGEGATLARKAAGSNQAGHGADLEWALAAVEDSANALIYRVDAAALAQDAAPVLFEALPEGLEDAVAHTLTRSAVDPLWVSTWVVMDELEWRSGARFPLVRMVEHVLAQQALLGGLAPAPR